MGKSEKIGASIDSNSFLHLLTQNIAFSIGSYCRNYFKIPSNIEQKKVILVDPMLATANSAIAATERLKNAGAKNICFICLLAAPEGIANFQKEYPEIKIYTVAIDKKLNEKGYILPGLGDAGDRIYNTK